MKRSARTIATTTVTITSLTGQSCALRHVAWPLGDVAP
jgi:hypothetical protein